MVVILISMLFGATTAGLTSHQTLYCDCFRSNFEGKVCQEVKGNASQGSCHK